MPRAAGWRSPDPRAEKHLFAVKPEAVRVQSAALLSVRTLRARSEGVVSRVAHLTTEYDADTRLRSVTADKH
jgi:hypothetical protein